MITVPEKPLFLALGSIRNGDMSTLWAQKITLKKLMKFTRFIFFILLIH